MDERDAEQQNSYIDPDSFEAVDREAEDADRKPIPTWLLGILITAGFVFIVLPLLAFGSGAASVQQGAVVLQIGENDQNAIQLSLLGGGRLISRAGDNPTNVADVVDDSTTTNDEQPDGSGEANDGTSGGGEDDDDGLDDERDDEEIDEEDNSSDDEGEDGENEEDDGDEGEDDSETLSEAPELEEPSSKEIIDETCEEDPSHPLCEDEDTGERCETDEACEEELNLWCEENPEDCADLFYDETVEDLADFLAFCAEYPDDPACEDEEVDLVCEEEPELCEDAFEKVCEEEPELCEDLIDFEGEDDFEGGGDDDYDVEDELYSDDDI
ncbi:MAG: hypothetical protein GYB68_16380 [Chloroflexi bacterium]|nr:hypothetical protein [Chloroflexota bacterium]